jgi:lipopolysaccharide/colanic/teichoic acid biosynthesis glycosyltransferase
MARLARFVAFGGVVATIAVWTALHARVLAPEPYEVMGTSRFPWTIVFSAGLLLAIYATGLPDLAGSRRSTVAATGVSALASAGVVSMAQLLLGAPLLPRSVVLGVSLTLFPLQLLAWNLATDGRRRSETRARVVVLADPESVAELRADLADGGEQPAVVVDAIDPRALAAAPIGARPVTAAVEAADANVLVLDVAAQALAPVVAEVAEAHSRGVRVRTLTLFMEEFLGKLPLGELERVSLLFDIGEIHRVRYNRAKRAVEVLLALSALPVLAVATVVVVAGNLVGNRGSLFYRQDRVGKGGAVFTILKFRTMRPFDGATAWTAADDPRITPFGRVLRRSHLDELPQLLNVLRGDLSLVGPRPEQPVYVEHLREKIPFYDVRHLVRPGLTGWAQVKYHYGGDTEAAMEKLQYDFYYLRRQSLGLDLRILVRTVRHVIRGAGR